MDIDIDDIERAFIVDAINAYLDAFPEYTEFADRFIDLLQHCGEVGCTLHIN